MAWIPSRFFQLPDERRLNSARPVRGNTHTIIGEDAAYLAAMRYRPVISHICFDDFAIGGYLTQAAPVHRLRWVTSDLTTAALSVHVAVIIEYLARRPTGGTVPVNPPQIIARLEDDGGAVIDNGCQWRVEDGTLPMRPDEGDIGGIITGFPSIVTTGFVPIEGESALGDPRPLNADPNKDTVLVVEGRDVRLYSISVLELHDAQVP